MVFEELCLFSNGFTDTLVVVNITLSTIDYGDITNPVMMTMMMNAGRPKRRTQTYPFS